MKRSLVIFSKYVIPLLSLTIFVTSGWLWHRSFRVADYFYRPEPTATGSALRGFGSCKGACLFGTILDSFSRQPSTQYQHDVFPLISSSGGGPPILAIRPSYKVGGLGFGISHGELAVNLPMAFLLPKRTYRVVYVPYYFIMLLAAIPVVRIGWHFARRRFRSGSSNPSVSSRNSPAPDFPLLQPTGSHFQ
jgi:hypothetical protein